MTLPLLSYVPPSAVPVLRPYQAEGIAALRAGVAAGKRRQLLVCPTGGGKTVLASALIRSALARCRRVLFIAHRLELIDQAVRQIGRWGVERIGVLRGADKRVDAEAPVQVASIQTLARRDKPPADVVIIDEAHRALADSYQKHIFAAYPEATIIGLTATPCRADGRGLGESFDGISIAATYTQLIADGFVMEPRVFSTPLSHVMGQRLAGLHTRAGDYADDELDEVVTDERLMGDVVETWKLRSATTEGAGHLRTVVFAVSVRHSLALVERFTAAGARAAHIDGTTPETTRRAVLAQLDAGDLTLVSNVGVLCEGWDQPSVKCLVLARPTKSLGLYMQMAGRVLRPWGETVPIIIDHGGNYDRHDAPTTDREWSMEGVTKRAAEVKARVCPDCYAYVRPRVPVCPHCGHDFREQIRNEEQAAREEERKAVELEERKRANAMSLFDKRRIYDELVSLAQRRGWKPGSASARFKERFGEWPPWAWSQETKRRYEADEQWMDAVSRRQREREHWEQVDAGKQADGVEGGVVEMQVATGQAVTADAGAVDGVPVVSDESFAAWWEEQ